MFYSVYIPDFIKGIVLFIIIVIVVIIAISTILNITNKKSIQKMYNDVEGILKSLIKEEDKENYLIQKNDNNAYDYLFKTPNCTYYIKIIPNQGNQEICINNSVKWQLRKTFNDETMRFVPDVEGLMRMDISVKTNFKKVYIIYPNARSLLKYINECEMVFVHPSTDVYGTSVIPYVALREKPGLLEEIGEI